MESAIKSKRNDNIATAITLGCSRLGSITSPLSAKECINLIGEAYNRGIRNFDTANIYGQGDSERHLGHALRKERANIQLASKAGQLFGSRNLLLPLIKPPLRIIAKYNQSVNNRLLTKRSIDLPRCFEIDYLKRSLHQSLKRLQTDYLDIFYLHSPSLDDLKKDDLINGLIRIKESGIVNALGISCDQLHVADAAASLPFFDVIQFNYDKNKECYEILKKIKYRSGSAALRGFNRPPRGLNYNHYSEYVAKEINDAYSHGCISNLIIATTNKFHLADNLSAIRKIVTV